MEQKVTTPRPGTYPYGHPLRLAEWDGETWSGRYAHNPDVPPAPNSSLPWWGFLKQIGFWLIVIGALLSFAFGYLFNNQSGVVPSIGMGAAMTVVMVGVVLLVDTHLQFRDLHNLPLLITMGILAGIVAALLASAIEVSLEPALKVPFAVDLWLAGFVEESVKNLLPFLLLLILPSVFGNPRGGVLMVLISGSVFGIIEGIQYAAAGGGDNSNMFQGIVRPWVEMAHPIWAATAAALIFLAAHRSGRAFTLAGFTGWLIACAEHSLHDGVATLSGDVHGTENTVTDSSYTIQRVFAEGLSLALFSLIVIIVAFVILRQVARELVPPTKVLSSRRHWRPQLALWGYSSDEKLEIELFNVRSQMESLP